jgi:hypothetical protein
VTDIGWVILGASVGYGGLAVYAVALAIRTRRAHRTLAQLRRGSS